jgi:phosphoglycerate dehydrogenase-like enzyme
LNYILTYQNDFPNLAWAIKKRLPQLKVIEVKAPREASNNESSQSKQGIGLQEIAILKDAEILVGQTKLVAQVMYQLPRIKWIQVTSAGVEIIIQAIRQHGSPPECVMTRHSGVSFGQIMGEYVCAQIINRERRYFAHHENTQLAKS